MGSVAKVVGLVVASAISVLVLCAVAIYLVSESRLNQTIHAPVESIVVPTDISSIQRGQHLAGAIALCADCHGANMAGRVVIDDASARIIAPNLTRGRAGISDADIARAIRYGVSPNGRRLVLMPFENYNRFGDDDLGALVAYIRSLPAIQNTLPTSEVRPIGRALLATGRLQLLPAVVVDPTVPRPAAPEPGLTPAYGEYLAAIAGCARCHTLGAPGDWSDADFLRAMRTGRRPDGRMFEASMPWQYFAQMTDLELRAIWRFLQVIPPQQTGTASARW
jgi:cytochrome c553